MASGTTVPSKDRADYRRRSAPAELVLKEPKPPTRLMPATWHERLHGERVEVRADPAEHEHRRTEQADKREGSGIGAMSAKTIQIVVARM